MRLPVLDATRSAGNGALRICSRVKRSCAFTEQTQTRIANASKANDRFISRSSDTTCKILVARLLRAHGLNRHFGPFERPADLHHTFRADHSCLAAVAGCIFQREICLATKRDAAFQADMLLRRTQL